ncbi:hypothetical protein EAH81_06230 [Flavobacterium pectinovorum]|uniref:Uncharacterized protein n=1 Tax=Flavobacterium pectinovorum TaxID=29533 RepID=A0A502F5H0_9FLAO|nr:hypothetical protein EAH81_06230 [Flavobacterium pectinovorum]
MHKIKELLKSDTTKMQLPFNSVFFVSEEVKKKKHISIEKYNTNSFIPYSCYKPIMLYFENEK